MGAVAAQGSAAGGSLVLQLLVARSIGEAGFGTYQLLLAALVLVTSVQTGFIGDTLTVLSREDSAVRGALAAAQGLFLLLGAAVAVGVALASSGGDMWLAVAFALATVFWLLEDTGRRLFIARMRFGGLVANDVVYFVATLATLVLLSLRRGELGLVDVLLATAAGAFAAAVAARAQLPGEDFRGGAVTRAGMREVASFAAWRSAQAGLRPLADLGIRATIAGIAGAAALGQLQAARLLMAPLFTALAGLGSFLLPAYMRRAPGLGLTARPALLRQTLALVGATLLYTGLLVFTADSLNQLLFGSSIDIDRVAVLSWGIFAAGFAAGLPIVTAALARRESRRVFVVRLADVVVGLPLVAAILVLVGPSLTPVGTAAGMVLATGILWRRRAWRQPTSSSGPFEPNPASAPGDPSGSPDASASSGPGQRARARRCVACAATHEPAAHGSEER
jgi:O-antigen/teichoic acid export membrane protein